MATLATVYVGMGPPYALRITLGQPAVGSFDYSTVSAVAMRAVHHDDESTDTWAASISGQSATGLVATHSFATSDLTYAGRITVFVDMTLPGGTAVSEPVYLRVKTR